MKIVIGIIIATILAIGVIDLHIYGYLSHNEKNEFSRILDIQKQGKYNDARLEWDKFLTEYPFNTEAYAELATTEVALGNLENAKNLIITSRTLLWSPRVKEAYYKKWYIIRDSLIIILTCELLYVIMTSLGKFVRFGK